LKSFLHRFSAFAALLHICDLALRTAPCFKAIKKIKEGRRAQGA
jgi:hypothetical protein